MPSKKPTSPKKVGRPRKELDENQIEQLASLGCTLEEMASFFNCDVKTLTSNFSQVIKRGKDVGKISLRRDQRRLAKNSAAMAIFLGKNELGQRDQPAQGTQSEDLETLFKAAAKVMESHA